jgi:hypothetical protein
LGLPAVSVATSLGLAYRVVVASPSSAYTTLPRIARRPEVTYYRTVVTTARMLTTLVRGRARGQHGVSLVVEAARGRLHAPRPPHLRVRRVEEDLAAPRDSADPLHERVDIVSLSDLKRQLRRGGALRELHTDVRGVGL